MLNAGFMRGARAQRVTNLRTDCSREYNVNVPRVLAGIRRLSATIADRSFRIELLRQHRDERMIRFNPRLQAEALARLRHDLHLASEHVNKVAVIYDRSEELRIPM